MKGLLRVRVFEVEDPLVIYFKVLCRAWCSRGGAITVADRKTKSEYSTVSDLRFCIVVVGTVLGPYGSNDAQPRKWRLFLVRPNQ